MRLMLAGLVTSFSLLELFDSCFAQLSFCVLVALAYWFYIMCLFCLVC